MMGFDDVHNSLGRRVNSDIVVIGEVCLMIINFFLNHRSYNVVVKEELIVLNNVGTSNVPQLFTINNLSNNNRHLRCQKRDPYSILACGNVERFSDGSNPPSSLRQDHILHSYVYVFYSYVSRISQRRKQATKSSYDSIVCNLQLDRSS